MTVGAAALKVGRLAQGWSVSQPSDPCARKGLREKRRKVGYFSLFSSLLFSSLKDGETLEKGPTQPT